VKFKWVSTPKEKKAATPSPFVIKPSAPSTTDIGSTQAVPPEPVAVVPAGAREPKISALPTPPTPVGLDGPVAAPNRPRPSISEVPKLEGEAAAAVAHRGSHIQIIASAGSGKTEVVSQRVASLLASGEPPESIVAFTFTEKAAAELKERIRERVTALQGAEATDQLGRLFVGTIHAFCFRMLQTYVPRYETYTPLDTNQLTNLLYRESYLLGLKNLSATKGVFQNLAMFQRGVDVLENEMIDLDSLPEDDFKAAVTEYYAMLDRYQFMSFGTQIVRAVEALQIPKIHAEVTKSLRHLIVDEYQDVNPAQECLIALLSKPYGSADLVVVGDDDQAIYQWRGSAVENIVTFDERYPAVKQFRLLTNRRSRPGIVELANAFAKTIPGRIEKEMRPFREGVGPSVAFTRNPGTEHDEAAEVAKQILEFRELGVEYKDMAILVRGRAAYPAILESLAAQRIPVQPGGRTGLFAQPEAEVFAATYAWIGEVEWSSESHGTNRQVVTLDRLRDDYTRIFDLTQANVSALDEHLLKWKAKALASQFNESLVGDFYVLVEKLGVKRWNLNDALTRNRLGTIARFTNVLADYEGVSWRARKDPKNHGEQVGAKSGGVWFYKNFAILLSNYAVGSYDDFAGEEDLITDGVALGTIHGAKGLEWPVVFLPSLVKTRFPSSMNGRSQDWPSALHGRFDVGRYEGSDSDERRLFYVAVTRARDAVLLSGHTRQKGGKIRNPSPYYEYARQVFTNDGAPTSISGKGVKADAELAITYSELAAFDSCPRSYMLKNQLGFMPTIQAELGYGNAVHHTMRVLAEATKATGTPPTEQQINQLLDSEFFLPYANKAGHKEMREKARKLVQGYVTDHPSDLLRTWATERPFELYLDGVVVSGRADVIYDEHNGQVGSLAIVDYKTSTGEQTNPLQLQIYTNAGRREGLDVSAAFIHDLGTTQRYDVNVDKHAIANAEAKVIATVESLKRREYEPKPERTKCQMCDVRRLCSAAGIR
jgi:DNA helicase-2/ATP-dependent DNA helicase PcrA